MRGQEREGKITISIASSLLSCCLGCVLLKGQLLTTLLPYPSLVTCPLLVLSGL